MAATSVQPSEGLQADAFKKLYPKEFLSRFTEDDIRPDGRPIGRCRPTTIGLDVVSTANGSALVKIGSTTILAGVKLETQATQEAHPNEGQIDTHVEMSAMATSSHRPGRFAEEAVSIQQRIQGSLDASCAVRLEDLCIDPGKAAWHLYLDIYILDAAGSVLDAALLAALAALASTRLPSVKVNEQGKVVSDSQQQLQADRLQLLAMPVSVTSGTFMGKLLVDPTAEEEPLLENNITMIVDSNGKLIAGRPSLLLSVLAIARSRRCQIATAWV